MSLNAEFVRHIEEALTRKDEVAEGHFRELQDTFQRLLREGMVFELPLETAWVDSFHRTEGKPMVDLKVVAAKLGVVPDELSDPRHFRRIVRKLGLPSRFRDAISRGHSGQPWSERLSHIRTFEELINSSEEDILDLPDVGPKALAALRIALMGILPLSHPLIKDLT